MSGILTKKDQQWWDNKENQFIFNFNLLWTSRDFWDRTPENVKPREEALKKLYRESCRHEPLVMQNFGGSTALEIFTKKLTEEYEKLCKKEEGDDSIKRILEPIIDSLIKTNIELQKLPQNYYKTKYEFEKVLTEIMKKDVAELEKENIKLKKRLAKVSA